MSCLEHIDAICYINLKHRVDRKEHILQEIKKIDPNLTKTHCITAEYTPHNGILGCVLSHIKALQFFLDHPEWKNCMILEDDYTFSSDPNTTLSYLLTTLPTYDVLLLSYGLCDYVSTETEYKSITRVLSSQTASGYIIHRDYAPILFDNFTTSSKYIAEYGKIHEYCIDIYWKRLMPLGKWYTFSSRIGYQYESFSDINNCVENYGC